MSEVANNFNDGLNRVTSAGKTAAKTAKGAYKAGKKLSRTVKATANLLRSGTSFMSLLMNPAIAMTVFGIATVGLVILCFVCMPMVWLGTGDAATDEEGMRQAYLSIVRSIKANYENPYQNIEDTAKKHLARAMELKYPEEENNFELADVSVVNTNFADISAEDAIATYYMAKSAVLHQYHETSKDTGHYEYVMRKGPSSEEIYENKWIPPKNDDIDLGMTFGPYGELFKTDVSVDQLKKIFTGGNVTYSDLDDSKLVLISDHYKWTHTEGSVPHQEAGVDVAKDVETDVIGNQWGGEAHVYVTLNFSEGFMDHDYDAAIDQISGYYNMSHEDAKKQLDSEIADMQAFIAEEAKLGNYYNLVLASAGMAMMFDGQAMEVNGQTGELTWYIIADEMDANGIYRFGQPEGPVAGLMPMQCTDFARWRFFKYYGWSYQGCNGAGGTVAACIVNNYPDKFELTTNIDKVKPGSIYSIVENGNGHVGFIEGFEDNNVVISDGNYLTGPYMNSLSINRRETVNGWANKSHFTTYQYAVPKDEYLNSIETAKSEEDKKEEAK